MQSLPFRGLAAAVKDDASWITIYMYQGKGRQILPDVAVTLEEVNLLMKKYPWLLTGFVASTMGVIQGTGSDICLKILKYFI